MAKSPLINIYRRLSSQLEQLQFGEPVTHVYNPLQYAWTPHERYLQAYGHPPKEVVFVGMNPGPFGMAQTGVPFGAVTLVRDWLGIEGPVARPPHEHPKRPVLGFDIDREEVSGARFWGWARDRFVTPKAFFERFFVANYCPLCFMEDSGRNRTPDKLPPEVRKSLLDLCDAAFREAVAALQPTWVIGLGKFAEDRARQSLEGMDVKIGRILHPSPASPAANRGWAETAEKQLRKLGIQLPAGGGRTA